MPDKSLIGTGITGSSHANATSFRKGRSGNPKGRPPGRFRVGSRRAALVLDAEAEALARKAVAMALDGDPVAVRFCLGRLLGARQGQPVALDLPQIAGPGDLAAAVTTITAALADCRLTPDEALTLARMLGALPRALAATPTPVAAPDPASGGEDPRLVLMKRLQRLAEGRAASDG